MSAAKAARKTSLCHNNATYFLYIDGATKERAKKERNGEVGRENTLFLVCTMFKHKCTRRFGSHQPFVAAPGKHTIILVRACQYIPEAKAKYPGNRVRTWAETQRRVLRQEAYARFQALLSVYTPAKLYGPPSWCSDKWCNVLQFSKTVVVYSWGVSKFTAATWSRNDTLDLLRYREPVNIAMETRAFWDTKKFKTLFGWNTSGYCQLTQNGKVHLPTCCVYCLTPFVSGSVSIPEVHVLTVFGLGFDSKKQPDYMLFHKGGKMNVPLIWRAYKHIYAQVFAFANANRFENIELSLVGCGAFATHSGITPSAMQAGMKQICNTLWKRYPTINNITFNSYVPNDVAKKNSPTTLWVNAGDPHSLLGNGHEGDASLDGYWGRSTAICALGWPETNPEMNCVHYPLSRASAYLKTDEL